MKISLNTWSDGWHHRERSAKNTHSSLHSAVLLRIAKEIPTSKGAATRLVRKTIRATCRYSTSHRMACSGFYSKDDYLSSEETSERVMFTMVVRAIGWKHSH